MKNIFVLTFFLLLASCFSNVFAQCDPLPADPVPPENLAKTPRPLKEIIGANAGFEIEHFNGQDGTISLADFGGGLSYIRFFYQHDKDYYNNREQNPSDRQRFPINLDFSDIPTREELIDSKYFWNNYTRVMQIKNTGLKVHAAIEISTRGYPNKWWKASEIDDSDPINYINVQAKGKDWANAFLRVYDPKNTNGNGFQFGAPLIDILELGNEPWGDPGLEGYIRYTQGMVDAFIAYYGNNPSQFRIKLAGAAFQDHEPQSPILDLASVMISPGIKDYLSEGVGVHNYNKADYCTGSITTVKGHPEADNGGFGIYKNMSKWVKNNMPAGNQKLNATEFGWPSDDEPTRIYSYVDVNGNQVPYGTPGSYLRYYDVDVIGISYPGCEWNYQTNQCGDPIQRGIGRTIQSAYIVRSILMLHRWGANQAAVYQLRDDWTSEAFFSYGLIDRPAPRTLTEFQNGTVSVGKEKESWKAVQRTVGALGSKYFLNYYGTEGDGQLYCYVYGDGGTGNAGKPTHMVVWRAVKIGEEYKNLENNEVNITKVEQNLVDNFDFASLDFPEGLVPDIEGKAIYLDGRETTLEVPVSDFYDADNNKLINISPIPMVIPLKSERDFCIDYYTGEVIRDCEVIGGCEGSDIDGDGICDEDDCDPKDPDFPKPLGTACDDGDPNTTNDVITGDGCTCKGTADGGGTTTFNCLGAVITYGNGMISVNITSGQTNGITIYDVNNNWHVVGYNNWNTSSLTVNLPNGTYRVAIGRDLCEEIIILGNPSGSSIMITCPNNITVTESSPNEGGAPVFWNTPTATSNCNTGQVSISQTGGLSSGSIFPVGVTVVQFQATDNCGSVATCSFNVTVLDMSAPDNYCQTGASEPWQEWISKVNFRTISNSSGKEGYGDFTSISTNVQRGQSYQITITPGFSYFQWNEYFRVWIDFNRDGDFSDAGEIAFSGVRPAGTPPTITPVIGSISIPSNASLGGTRMRIAMQRGSFASPCTPFILGEVEDYTLQITNNLTDEVDNRSDHTLTTPSIESTIELFPNPTSGVVNVNLAGYQGKEIDIQVINQLGRVVQQYEQKHIAEDRLTLNLAHLEHGLYFIQFKTKEGVPVVKRMVIGR